MSNTNNTGTQTLNSSSETVELGLGQEPEMNTQEIDTSADQSTLVRLVDERIKQATDPILRLEELCALLVSQTEMESTGNSEVSDSKRDNASTSPHVSGTTALS